jgi:nucleotide-binding universal stress UspA family protein
MYRKVMVPLDGTTFAEHALPLARSIARRSGAELHLVAVVPPLTGGYTEGVFFSTAELDAEAVERQEAYLDGVRERLGEGLHLTTAVLEGDIATSLSAHAAARDVELVVMATHGRGPLARFWLGSVADQVMRFSHLPILLVRPEEEPVDLAKEPEPHKVILCLDGTELSERIIEPAVNIGALLPEVEFLLVRVIKPVVPAPAALEGPTVEEGAQRLLHEIQAAQERLYREAESYLREVAGRLEARGLRTEVRVAVDERPEEAILHEAEAAGAGIIALETHGRAGLVRLVRGSVADKVLRSAHVPVLVQRPVTV